MHRSSNSILVTERARDWAQRVGPDIDAATVERLMALDPDDQTGLMARLLSLFESTLRQQLEAMETALEAADVPGVRRAAHALRSASASFGALHFAQACADLERLARESSAQPSPACDEALRAPAAGWGSQARDLLSRVQSAAAAARG